MLVKKIGLPIVLMLKCGIYDPGTRRKSFLKQNFAYLKNPISRDVCMYVASTKLLRFITTQSKFTDFQVQVYGVAIHDLEKGGISVFKGVAMSPGNPRHINFKRQRTD